jgi:hypothetical protein
MKTLFVFCVAWLAAVACAQTTPSLHQRTAQGQAAVQPDKTDFVRGYSTLPEDASGEYELDKDGSVVQITIENGRLSGYVTKMEQGSALTLFFLHTSIHGGQITFTTKAVHGVSYSFDGNVVRGEKAVAASETGFYRLVGEMTEHSSAGAGTARVSLQSTPRIGE